MAVGGEAVQVSGGRGAVLANAFARWWAHHHRQNEAVQGKNTTARRGCSMLLLSSSLLCSLPTRKSLKNAIVSPHNNVYILYARAYVICRAIRAHKVTPVGKPSHILIDRLYRFQKSNSREQNVICTNALGKNACWRFTTFGVFAWDPNSECASRISYYILVNTIIFETPLIAEDSFRRQRKYAYVLRIYYVRRPLIRGKYIE